MGARGRVEEAVGINVLELSAVFDGELDTLTLSTVMVSSQSPSTGKGGVMQGAIEKNLKRGRLMFGEVEVELRSSVTAQLQTCGTQVGQGSAQGNGTRAQGECWFDVGAAEPDVPLSHD